MEGNEEAAPAQAGEDKIDHKLAGLIFRKMNESIAVEPVESKVAMVTKKVTLASANGVAFYVADERSVKAAKIAMQLLALKFAADMAEALADPERLVKILAS